MYHVSVPANNMIICKEASPQMKCFDKLIEDG
jgi:hypothetical protein